MSLGLTPIELVARARSDLRMGVAVALAGDGAGGGADGGAGGGAGDATDGGGGALVIAAETATGARLDDLRGRGPLDLAITGRRAETLKARAYDGDLARVAVPRDAGIDWVHATADPSADLAYPLKGPYVSRRDGSAALHRAAIALCKQSHLLPAALVLPLTGAAVVAEAAGTGLTLLRLGEIPLVGGPRMVEAAAARVPLQVSEAGRVHVFRPGDGTEEHYAVEIGSPDRREPVLCRLHSACFTGDVLGSLKCDCGPQLHAALDQLGSEGAGVLLYLNQEGRGIGLANKMRAYALQDQGFDTVEANHRLGFEDDERDFRIGADILRAMGFGRVRLMTNNPKKVAMMTACGLEVVERVPLRVGRTRFNDAYLRTKAAKSGHLL